MLESLAEHQLPPLLEIEPDWLLAELLLDIWRLNLSQTVKVLADVELIYGMHVQELMDLPFFAAHVVRDRDLVEQALT